MTQKTSEHPKQSTEGSGRLRTSEAIGLGTALGAFQLLAAVLQLFGDWTDRLQIVLFLCSLAGAILTWRLVRRLRSKQKRMWLTLVGVSIASALVAGGVLLSRSGEPDANPTVQLSARVLRNATIESSRPHGLTKEDDGWTQNVTASVSDTVEWRLSVQTSASSDDLSVMLYFPAEVSPVADPSVGTLNGRTLSLNRPGLTEAQSGFVTIKATVSEIPYCPRSSFLLAIVRDGTANESTAISPLTSFDPTCDNIEGAGRWYPGDRQSWDWNVDKEGPTEYPVLNSYFNTPYYGDERSFLDAAPFADADRENSFRDVTPVSAFGDRVIVRMYVINDANENVQPPLIAKDARVRMAVPSGRAPSLRVRGYISASNAVPPMVEDTADFVSDTPFRLEYVAGSAKAYGAQLPKGGHRLPDDIVGPEGAAIGTTGLDGDLLPDFGAQMSVEIELIVIPG